MFQWEKMNTHPQDHWYKFAWQIIQFSFDEWILKGVESILRVELEHWYKKNTSASIDFTSKINGLAEVGASIVSEQ